jgi:hypothetical protein
MRDVILITPNWYGLNSIKETLPKELVSIVDEPESRLTVILNESNETIEFVLDNSIIQYYDEPEELEALTIVGDAPKFFLIHFKNIEQMKKLLEFVANRSDVLIDNDFGIIEDGVSFVRRCKESPGWDWV